MNRAETAIEMGDQSVKDRRRGAADGTQGNASDDSVVHEGQSTAEGSH